MRWLKHLSMAHEDPKMTELLETEGIEAYGVYWLLLECIASAMESGSDRPELTHSIGHWAQKLHIYHTSRCHHLIYVLTNLHLISTKSTLDRVTISVPKLLKYRDEYSKKSGHSPENVRPRVEQRENRERAERKPAAESTIVEAAAAEATPRKARAVLLPNQTATPDYWHALLFAAQQVGMTFAAGQLARLEQTFARLPNDQRRAAVAGIEIRITSGEYADSAYVPALRRYLSEQLWTAPLRASPRSGKPSKNAEYNRIFDEMMQSNVERMLERKENQRAISIGSAKVHATAT
jgi:hypothetical protein